MKIIFITSSLEPGRDGVGDYTRILAVALIKLGHTVTALTLQDKFITTEFSGIQLQDSVELAVWRLPYNLGTHKSFAKATDIINTINPDWISIQFVIFTYNDKGLPFYLVKQFNQLTKGRNCHIMFHELWVGIHTNSSLKYFVWGWFQKQIIKNMLLNLKPASIHTHTRLYQKKIYQVGFKAAYLPLFGNIPVIKNNVDQTNKLQAKIIRLVYFGTIHANTPVEDFVRELVDYYSTNKVSFEVDIIGRTGDHVKEWLQVFKKAGIKVLDHGELSAIQISEILSNAAIGISTTPILFSEKSGTIAAMLEHGLPVLCVAKKIKVNYADNFLAPDGVFDYTKGNLEFTLKNIHSSASNLKVSQVAAQLISFFNRANNKN